MNGVLAQGLATKSVAVKLTNQIENAIKVSAYLLGDQGILFKKMSESESEEGGIDNNEQEEAGAGANRGEGPVVDVPDGGNEVEDR